MNQLAIQRLTWAGVRLVYRRTTVLIDAIEDVSGWVDHDEDALKAKVVRLMGPENGVALITHIHNDHFDPPAVHKALGESVTIVCSTKIVEEARLWHGNMRPLELHEPFSIPKRNADFVVRPVPASDGLGDFQVSWIVRAGDRCLIHCGDTLWHGEWWKIADQYGPFDLAFLPINGVVLRRPGLRDADVPASMTPEQAAAAAYALGARMASPIHYDLFGNQSTYVPAPNAKQRFVDACRELSVETLLLAPGEWHDL